MSSIGNYFGSACGFVKGCTKFAWNVAKVTGIKLGLVGVLSTMGLDKPVNILARAVEPLSFPLVEACVKVTDFATSVLPTFHYQSELIFTHKDLNDVFSCEKVKNQAGLFNCRWNLAPIIAGITEEIIFRDILQKGILPRIANYFPGPISPILHNKFSRIFVASLIFAAGHYQSGADNVVYQFAGGLTYGYVYEVTNNLDICVGAHMLNNALFTLIATKIMRL